MMRIVILEDERYSAANLTNHLHRFDPGIEICAVLPSISAFKEWTSGNEAPDLILSDIELADGNIFSYLPSVALSCPMIFATAYDMFRQEAFDNNGIGYVLKPITYSKLEAALQKYNRLRASFEFFEPAVWDHFQKKLEQYKRNYKKRFAVKEKNGIILLSVEMISFLQSNDGIVSATDQKGRKHFINESLQSLEEVLDPAVFFRLNRSTIINIHFIEKIESYFDDRLSVKLLNRQEPLITSTNRTPLFRKWLE